MKKYHLRLRRRSLEVRCIIIVTGQLFCFVDWLERKKNSNQFKELGHHLVYHGDRKDTTGRRRHDIGRLPV
jgi:hypothetical protein